MKRKQTTILILFLIVIYAGPLSAQTQVPPAKDFGELIQDIFGWALALVGAAVFVNFLWAGFLWFSAAGRPGPISQAKEKMTNALIGAIILLASFLILKTINPDLVKQTFTLPGLQKPATQQQQQNNSNQQNNSFSRNNFSNQNLSAGGDADDAAINETLNDILYGNYGLSEIEEKATEAGLIVGRLLPSDQYDPEFIVIRHPRTKIALMNILASPLVINTGPGTSPSCGFFWESSCGGFGGYDSGGGGGLPITSNNGSRTDRKGSVTTPEEFKNDIALCAVEYSNFGDIAIIMANGKPYGTYKKLNRIVMRISAKTNFPTDRALMTVNKAIDSINDQFKLFNNLPRFEFDQSGKDSGDITILLADYRMLEPVIDNNILLGLAINSHANIGGKNYEHATIFINADLLFEKSKDILNTRLYNTIVHEIGHLLSLGHSGNGYNSIMDQEISRKPDFDIPFTLHEIRTLLDIYGNSSKELSYCEKYTGEKE